MNIIFSDILAALALVFILEGLMPFINPETSRRIFLMATQMNNQALRFLGLMSILFGLVLLYFAR